MILALVLPVSVRKPKAAVGTEWVWMSANASANIWKRILGLWAEAGKQNHKAFPVTCSLANVSK